MFELLFPATVARGLALFGAKTVEYVRTSIVGDTADTVEQARSENSSLIAAAAGAALLASAIVIYKEIK